MSKRGQSVKANSKLVEALSKINIPIVDNKHNLKLFFKPRSRSNETGFEHIAKSYHGLKKIDFEDLEARINKPLYYSKDKRYDRVFNYYLYRKRKQNSYLKISIKIDKFDNTKAYILTMFITKHIN